MLYLLLLSMLILVMSVLLIKPRAALWRRKHSYPVEGKIIRVREIFRKTASVCYRLTVEYTDRNGEKELTELNTYNKQIIHHEAVALSVIDTWQPPEKPDFEMYSDTAEQENVRKTYEIRKAVEHIRQMTQESKVSDLFFHPEKLAEVQQAEFLDRKAGMPPFNKKEFLEGSGEFFRKMLFYTGVFILGVIGIMILVPLLSH